MTSARPDRVASRRRWTFALAALALATPVAMQAHGRASRRHAVVADRRPAIVTTRDAAEALRVWFAAGVRGRRVVVLTGRWSKPTAPDGSAPPRSELDAAARGARVQAADASGALFVAAQAGIARAYDVVMPAAALARRLEAVAGQKELIRERDAFRLPREGFERRFAAAAADTSVAEPVLLLVEPSFLDAGGLDASREWLSGRRATFDLAVLALDDPEASDAKRAAAARLADSIGARPAELRE